MLIKEKIQELPLTNDVPQEKESLGELRNHVKDFFKNRNFVPPLQQDEILVHTIDFILQYPEFATYQKLIAVLVNNMAWESIVYSIPYNKRILLLPQCLKSTEFCTAPIDELGLLCKSCGKCSVTDISKKAESLGYHVIVSEGTGAVSLLLKSGQVECVIGVGCLDSFERSFSLTVNEAIPSLAIPLFNSDCKDSTIDQEWLNQVLESKNNETKFGHINFDKSREKIESWFSIENLRKVLNSKNETEEIAIEWLNAGGKRWRPLIMVNVFESFHVDESVSSESIMKLAIAVECFHKASLAHDDIADNDAERYDIPTLHEKYDVSVALNSGDLLLGFGYQLIAESGLKPEQITKLLSIASSGHRNLCLGQGQELLGRNNSHVLPVDDIINIFKNKTAPAFEVALKFGGILANANEKLIQELGEYSKAIGIAYQIKDDIEDFNQEHITNDISKFRPSLILSLLDEKYPAEMQEYIQRFLNNDQATAFDLFQWANEAKIIEETKTHLENYQYKALDAIKEIEELSLKIFLFRLTNKIVTIKK